MNCIGSNICTSLQAVGNGTEGFVFLFILGVQCNGTADLSQQWEARQGVGGIPWGIKNRVVKNRCEIKA